MAYDDGDIVMIGQKPIHRRTVFAQLKGLGWSKERVAEMSDDELTEVVKNKTQAPAEQPVAQPAGPIDLDNVGEDPEIMGNGAAKLAAEIGEPSVVKPVGAPPPSPKHLRPVDPTRPAAASPAGPAVAPAQPAIVVAEPPPPVADMHKLTAILKAADALAQSPATAPTARTLVESHGLLMAFMTLYPQSAGRVLKENEVVNYGPEYFGEGSVILAVEKHANGIHIITSTGTLTISGASIKAKRN